jgi:hypothetical protein
MNPLTSLVTTLHQELGIDTPEVSASVAPQIEALQAVIMEAAIATYLSTVDPETGRMFVEWVEAHHADADLLTAVFEKFPDLMLSVHDEMVAAIDGVKKNSAV